MKQSSIPLYLAGILIWETAEFVEVKMDAEINSYQDDFGGDRDTGVISPSRGTRAEIFHQAGGGCPTLALQTEDDRDEHCDFPGT
jgi:hypothetical protein